MSEDDETLFHVRRRDLPWRAATLTECGLKADKNFTVSRDELLARIKKNGQRKTELVACNTCYSTARRYTATDSGHKEDRETLHALHREIERSGSYGEPRGPLATELRALGILVTHHQEEFDELCADVDAVVPLGSRRPQ